MDGLDIIFDDSADCYGANGAKSMSKESFIEVVKTIFNNKYHSTHLPRCSRVEVIDGTGRAYTNMSCNFVEKQMQDDDRTLKIFIT